MIVHSIEANILDLDREKMLKNSPRNKFILKKYVQCNFFDARRNEYILIFFEHILYIYCYLPLRRKFNKINVNRLKIVIINNQYIFNNYESRKRKIVIYEYSKKCSVRTNKRAQIEFSYHIKSL